jgi:hypothetical protein
VCRAAGTDQFIIIAKPLDCLLYLCATMRRDNWKRTVVEKSRHELENSVFMEWKSVVFPAASRSRLRRAANDPDLDLGDIPPPPRSRRPAPGWPAPAALGRPRKWQPEQMSLLTGRRRSFEPACSSLHRYAGFIESSREVDPGPR